MDQLLKMREFSLNKNLQSLTDIVPTYTRHNLITSKSQLNLKVDKFTSTSFEEVIDEYEKQQVDET